jgi:transcription initiation factor TFIIH subunit 1
MPENYRFTVVQNKKNNFKFKAQKISTEGKAKVQLQVVLHDDTSSIFHFVSPAGPQQQIKDRDQAKDLLAGLLPNFKKKIDKELEEKKRLGFSQKACFL